MNAILLTANIIVCPLYHTKESEEYAVYVVSGMKDHRLLARIKCLTEAAAEKMGLPEARLLIRNADRLSESDLQLALACYWSYRFNLN